MICQHCGEGTVTLSRSKPARSIAQGCIEVRSYICLSPACKQETTTWELPLTAIMSLGRKNVLDRVATLQRGTQARSTAALRKARIPAMLAAGMKSVDIALALNVTAARVRQLIKEMK